MKRFKINNKASKKMFSKNAGSHSLNFRGNPMRGGIRL